MAKYCDIFRDVLNAEAEGLYKQIESVDPNVFDSVVDLLCSVKTNGHKVITAGCGTSGAAAKKIAHTLNVVEIPSYFLSPADAVHGGLGTVQKGDVVVLISKGGNTQELIRYIPACREKGAVILGVSENPGSVIAVNSDLFLKVGVGREPCPWNMVATASTMAVMAVFDAVALAAMRHNGFTKQQFLRIHPSGAVGLRLQEELGKPGV
jgi:D-arabinose 5-phosphate isomerase GutQ